MKFIVKYEGETYTSQESTEGGTAEQAKELLYESIEDVNKFTMSLEQGGFLVLGPEAAKRAAIIIKD